MDSLMKSRAFVSVFMFVSVCLALNDILVLLCSYRGVQRVQGITAVVLHAQPGTNCAPNSFLRFVLYLFFARMTYCMLNMQSTQSHIKINNHSIKQVRIRWRF